MGNKILRILLFILCGSASIVVLYLASGAPNTRKNGFSRQIKENYLTTGHFLNLEYSGYKISGATKSNIFLINEANPTQGKIIDLTVIKSYYINWSFDFAKHKEVNSIMIDSPFVNTYNRWTGVFSKWILKYNNPVKIDDDSIPGKQFNLGVPIGKSFVARTLNRDLHQYTLSKANIGNKKSLENIHAIEKQIDGYLCCDGMLFYDTLLHRVIYVYYYRNQFLILDSNLKLIQKARTIDTTTTAHIEVYNYLDKQATSFRAPAHTINNNACTSSGRLFIWSGLLADNEDRKTFSNNSIVDVYDLKSGKYLFSFYIPHFGKFKVNSFQVYDKILIAMEGDFIVSYKIND
jgi:hypothetical protein